MFLGNWAHILKMYRHLTMVRIQGHYMQILYIIFGQANSVLKNVY